MTDKPQSFSMTLGEDRKTVRLNLPATLTLKADELENVMRQLAVMRANMLPAMPDEDLNETSVWSVVPATRWYVSPDPDAPTQIRLYLMHLGYGWIWMPLARQGAEALMATMQKVLRNLPKLQ